MDILYFLLSIQSFIEIYSYSGVLHTFVVMILVIHNLQNYNTTTAFNNQHVAKELIYWD